jgi:urease accessory protein
MLMPQQTFAATVRHSPAIAIDHRGWQARLGLAFEADARDGKTVLRAAHIGPLRIQKALYPEGPGVCHAIIVHPPAGIAAGDELSIDATLPAGCAALLTTPGAAKWYGSHGDEAHQRICIALHGSLEWLPLEGIIFNRALVNSEINIRAFHQARMIGWDILIFGRKARGETFSQGRFRQSIRLHLESEPIWEDRLVIDGDDRLMRSPAGLAGRHALACCWALLPEGSAWTDDRLTQIRSACTAIAWTTLHPRLLVGRMLDDPLTLRRSMTMAWQTLRPIVMQREPHLPRIWAT